MTNLPGRFYNAVYNCLVLTTWQTLHSSLLPTLSIIAAVWLNIKLVPDLVVLFAFLLISLVVLFNTVMENVCTELRSRGNLSGFKHNGSLYAELLSHDLFEWIVKSIWKQWIPLRYCLNRLTKTDKFIRTLLRWCTISLKYCSMEVKWKKEHLYTEFTKILRKEVIVIEIVWWINDYR